MQVLVAGAQLEAPEPAVRTAAAAKLASSATVSSAGAGAAGAPAPLLGPLCSDSDSGGKGVDAGTRGVAIGDGLDAGEPPVNEGVEAPGTEAVAGDCCSCC